MDLGLRDRVYLVTGASQGLGYAAADQLVADGAKVVVCSRNEERITDAARRLGDDSAVGVALDLATPSAADSLVAMALKRFGRLDGAVISVGGPPPGDVSAVTDEQWRAAFESVFLGAVRLARTVLAADRTEPADDRSVTLVLSSSVRSPIGGLGISNGLRPGLAMAAKTLADEHGPTGGRVNVLLPGRIDTDRVRQLDASGGDPEASRARAVAGIPLRRYGRPEEFGKVAAFVASPAASFMSGSAITVDGGMVRTL
ncbi:SDR family oxidoreductase [Segeticoccus rhizosphaerae]|jgi:3-oxoacyl-[acyl-carrier protein] reductase|uniref:SDR family oxidoreductase n=2 Tax=Segeticoccus rhizosphaerae TaxID=1104777 RepID=UPI0010C0C5F6|nr:SDR family oxidoreductase [Ornithinicoccus soli]